VGWCGLFLRREEGETGGRGEVLNTFNVAIPAWNRLEYLQETIAGLAICRGSDRVNLILSIDGGGMGTKEVFKSVEFGAFKSVEVIKQPNNIGCWKNSKTVIEFGLSKGPSCFFLEEDVVPLPDFLEWAEWASQNIVARDVWSASAFTFTKPPNGDEGLSYRIEHKTERMQLYNFSCLGLVVTADRWPAIASCAETDNRIMWDRKVAMTLAGRQLRPTVNHVKHIGAKTVQSSMTEKMHDELFRELVYTSGEPMQYQMTDSLTSDWYELQAYMNKADAIRRMQDLQ
jgi:hypothetical protein